MNRDSCDGFMIYHSSYFFGIKWWQYKDAFDEDPKKLNTIFDILHRENTTLLHFSNYLSNNLTIKVGSSVGYGEVARMYCPKVYNSCGEYF